MAAKDYRASVEGALRPGLAPDETLLAVSPLLKDPGVTEDVSIADELKCLLDPTLYLGLGSHPGMLMQQATFGRALVGSPDSVAGRLFAAVDEVTQPAIAVTDHGIVIFDVDLMPRGKGWLQRMFGPVDRVATLVHRVRRGNLVVATPAPRGVLRRGRLLLAFMDGSGCALVCSIPSLAGPVVTAIGPPQHR